MPSNLLAQVQKLAEAQKACALGKLERSCTLDGQIIITQSAQPYLNILGVAEDLITEEPGPLDLDNVRNGVGLLVDAYAFDFPALAARFAYLERVEEAAKAIADAPFGSDPNLQGLFAALQSAPKAGDKDGR